MLADPSWNFEAAFARYREGYRIDIKADASVRGSRTGELIARCMVETGTSSYYTALGDATQEPVLKQVCRLIAADEYRHFKLFYDHMKRYLSREELSFPKRLRVAAGRIGLFGISLGGGIALGVAAQDQRVGALVSYFGFVPSGFDPSAALPPTLVLHGEDDRVVPVSNARTLQRILEARGTPHEVQIYPGEGHGFSAAATADAAARITRFFGRTLGGRRS